MSKKLCPECGLHKTTKCQICGYHTCDMFQYLDGFLCACCAVKKLDAQDARIRKLEDIAYPAFNFFRSLVDLLSIAKSVYGKKQVECGMWEYRIRLRDNRLNEYIQAQHALQNAINEYQAEGGQLCRK